MRDANLKLLGRANNYNAVISMVTTQNITVSDLEKLLVPNNEGLISITNCLENIDNVSLALAKIRSQLLLGNKVSIKVDTEDCYWQWNKESFASLLAAAGIEHEHTEENDNNFTFLLSCTSQGYNEFLTANNLPKPSIKHLLITTEHSDYRVTGGIGSYAKECDKLYGDLSSILLIDSNQDVDIKKINSKRWLAAQQFLSEKRFADIEFSNFDTMGDIVLETLESILCLYPGIESIESQEMLLGRVISAKHQGILGYTPQLITVCHGSSFHLAKAQRTVIEAENIHVAYREKYTLENSDTVIFPTKFLRDSYVQSGVKNLDDHACVTKRLPFAFERLPKGKILQQYKRLIYIGKTSTVKGFDLFLESLLELYRTEPQALDSLEEILVIATSTHIAEPYLQSLFIEVESKLPVKMTSLAREELLAVLAEYSADSLALVTYLGDNHPLAVLEFMAIGLDFIAADAAGTPELIPEKFKKKFLIAPTKEAFAIATAKALSQAGARSENIKALRSTYLAEQAIINRSYNLDYFRSAPRRSLSPPKKTNDTIGIIVVDTEGDEKMLQRTLKSIDAQSHKPSSVKVLKLNEASPADCVEDLMMRLYAGDTLHRNALSYLNNALRVHEKSGVAFSYETTPTYEGKKLVGIKEFHPFAPQLGSVFLQEKYGRRFVGLFRKEYFLFDASSDWQKAINASCAGATVEVVPRLLIHLAETENYPDWNRMRDFNNLIRSFSVLPTFDSFILHSELYRYDDIYWGNNLRNHMLSKYVDRQEAERIYGPSDTQRKATYIYRTYVPKPLRITTSYILSLTYRVIRKIYRAIF